MNTKIHTLISFLLLAVLTYGQDITLNFTGTGASNSIDSIRIENLTQKKSILLSGSDNIILKENLTSTSITKPNSGQLDIYPNPSKYSRIVRVDAQKSRSTILSIYSLSGSLIAQSVSPGQSMVEFIIKGLSQGIYIARVQLDNTTLSARIISHSAEKNEPYIALHKLSPADIADDSHLKNASEDIIWQYNPGDRLHFTGSSGNMASIVVDVPETSKTITFEYSNCEDADENHYATVAIGNQIWMAENLATTKYKNGTEIPLINDKSDWLDLNSPGMCWYNNQDVSEGYGALYNFYAAHTDSLCPTGWHVATADDWQELIELGGGLNTAGGKLKASGTNSWNSPNSGATNEFGFGALPAGGRVYGDFNYEGQYGGWWCATQGDTEHGEFRNTAFNSRVVGSVTAPVKHGYSIRCIKD